MLRYIKKTKCKKLIFLSSVYVYSGSKSKIYKENLELKPKEALGKSKLISENLIKNFVKKNDLCSYLLRAFTIYGTNSRKSQFLPMIIRQIQNKNLSKIVLKKPQIMRDFLHVDDLVEAIFLCLKYKNKKNLNIFNVASGKSLSVGFIVQKLIKISGNNKKLSMLPVKQTISHVGDRSHYANIDKIKNQLTWEPKININRGLKKFYEQKQK